MIKPTKILSWFLASGLCLTAAQGGEPFSNISLTQPSQSSGGFYLRGYGGLNWLEDIEDSEFDTGWLAGGSFGYRFADDALGALRLEIDSNYSENEIDVSREFEGEFGLTTIAFNVLHDFNTGSRLRPYLGFGLGAGLPNSDLTAGGRTLTEDDDAIFLYQFIGGLEFEVNASLSLFTEYRYVGLDDFTLSSSRATYDGEDFGGHQLLFGARIAF